MPPSHTTVRAGLQSGGAKKAPQPVGHPAQRYFAQPPFARPIQQLDSRAKPLHVATVPMAMALTGMKNAISTMSGFTVAANPSRLLRVLFSCLIM